MKTQEVTLNAEQQLYIIPAGNGGFSCYGFDVLERKTQKLRDWLLSRRVTRVAVDHMMEPDWKPTNGTLAAYSDYEKLLDVASTYCHQADVRCDIELNPELIGLEGRRVEVTNMDGETRRFIVGKSTGWMPCHLEVSRRDSSGGSAAMEPFKKVRVLASR